MSHSVSVRLISKKVNSSHQYQLKDVGVADLGFCYADSRQTGSGYYPKTFVAWRTTLQNKPGLLSLLKNTQFVSSPSFFVVLLFLCDKLQKNNKNTKKQKLFGRLCPQISLPSLRDTVSAHTAYGSTRLVWQFTRVFSEILIRRLLGPCQLFIFIMNFDKIFRNQKKLKLSWLKKFLNHNRCLFVENPHSKTPNQRHPHHKRFHVTIWYHIHKPPGWPRLNTRPLAFFNETRILDFISEKIWKYLENCLDFNFIRLFFSFWLRRPELGRMWQKTASLDVLI